MTASRHGSLRAVPAGPVACLCCLRDRVHGTCVYRCVCVVLRALRKRGGELPRYAKRSSEEEGRSRVRLADSEAYARRHTHTHLHTHSRARTQPPLFGAQRGSAGCWVRSWPWRFLNVTRWLENLSSGEKRAATGVVGRGWGSGRARQWGGGARSVRGQAAPSRRPSKRAVRGSPGWAEWVGLPSGPTFCEERSAAAGSH